MRRLPAWTTPIIAIAVIYPLQEYSRGSVDPEARDAIAYNLTGKVPKDGTLVVTRNREALNAQISNGRYISSVPLLPGDNHIEARVNGVLAKSVTIKGPSPVSQVIGDCRGTIVSSTTSGFDGEPFSVTISIEPSSAAAITRVVTHNPLCPDCDAVTAQTPNLFVKGLVFQGTGPTETFQVDFDAYDAQNHMRCHGTTVPLTIFAKPKGDSK